LSEGMMSKKTKRLYDRMQHGISKKKDFVESLEDKRRAIEEQQQEKDRQVSGKKRAGAANAEPVKATENNNSKPKKQRK
jgi:hypothetical protein